jgi:hypothetical protein
VAICPYVSINMIYRSSDSDMTAELILSPVGDQTNQRRSVFVVASVLVSSFWFLCVKIKCLRLCGVIEMLLK